MKEIKQIGGCTVKEMRKSYKIFIGKPERKIKPGILRYRWKDNIKMHLNEVW